MSAPSAAFSSSSRSMRLMKDFSASLANAVFDMERTGVSRAAETSRALSVPQCGRPCVAVHLFLVEPRGHVGKRSIEYGLQTNRKSLCLFVRADQVLPHFDQDMRQAAAGAVAPERVAFKRSAIGLIFPN